MTWIRIDDLDEAGNYRVRYVLTTPPSFTFEIRATKLGMQLFGATPYYTDWIPINERITWCQYHAQKLKETGLPVPQHNLDRGEL